MIIFVPGRRPGDSGLDGSGSLGDEGDCEVSHGGIEVKNRS